MNKLRSVLKKRRAKEDPRVRRRLFSWRMFAMTLLVVSVLSAGNVFALEKLLKMQVFSVVASMGVGSYWVAMAFLAAIVLHLYTCRRFDRPMRALSRAMRQVTKNDFIANVSHEIRTPLTVMNSYASALARGGLSEAEQREYAATIAAASESLSTMVSNILRLNKLENQEITPNAAPYDLTRQLCDCALTHEARWEAKNIDFDAQLEERVMVLADEAMMEIVFNNLISNAIKFTEAGGRILLRQAKDGDQVVVTVADTGCGMDEATLGRIFDKFYQGDTSHSKEGNGLGLALVRRVLEISGGSISVTSAPGEGSEFTVRLPRMPETA